MIKPSGIVPLHAFMLALTLEKYKNSLLEFLSALNFSELTSLATTITTGKIIPKNSNDAIECILLHSEDAESVLKRKKITKEYLFNYLHWKKVGVLASLDKSMMIEKILDFWETHPALPNSKYNGYGHQSPQNDGHNRFPPNQVDNSQALVSQQTEVAKCGENPVNTPMDSNTLMMMALKFTEWFYGILNSDTSSGSLTTDHFWNESSAQIRIKSNGCVVEDEVAGDSASVVELFLKLRSSHGLFFAPNLTVDGVCAKVEPHGGVLILACGSLHKGAGNMVGVFEQVFMLYQDPLAGSTWKVCRTEMNLNSSSGALSSSMPKVNECEFISRFVLTEGN